VSVLSPKSTRDSEDLLIEICSFSDDNNKQRVDLIRFLGGRTIELDEILSHWIAKGFGSGEVVRNALGQESCVFELSDTAKKAANEIRGQRTKRSITEKFHALNWNAFSAIAAMIAAIAAVLAAYFAYLAQAKP
jgi:hypothetical protein